jgi:hypothetical protein
MWPSMPWRVCLSRGRTIRRLDRDHSNIARAYAALGKAGLDEVNARIIHVAKRCGFADPRILSADTTAQELPSGIPTSPDLAGAGPTVPQSPGEPEERRSGGSNSERPGKTWRRG